MWLPGHSLPTWYDPACILTSAWAFVILLREEPKKSHGQCLCAMAIASMFASLLFRSTRCLGVDSAALGRLDVTFALAVFGFWPMRMRQRRNIFLLFMWSHTLLNLQRPNLSCLFHVIMHLYGISILTNSGRLSFRKRIHVPPYLPPRLDKPTMPIMDVSSVESLHSL